MDNTLFQDLNRVNFGAWFRLKDAMEEQCLQSQLCVTRQGTYDKRVGREWALVIFTWRIYRLLLADTLALGSSVWTSVWSQSSRALSPLSRFMMCVNNVHKPSSKDHASDMTYTRTGTYAIPQRQSLSSNPISQWQKPHRRLLGSLFSFSKRKTAKFDGGLASER